MYKVVYSVSHHPLSLLPLNKLSQLYHYHGQDSHGHPQQHQGQVPQPGQGGQGPGGGGGGPVALKSPVLGDGPDGV